MNVLIVGAGRMGLRHLRGTLPAARSLHLVDPRPEALDAAAEVARQAGFTGSLVGHASLDAALATLDFDAVVLAETAAGRASRVERVLAAGIRALLIEKPLEQSRAGVHAIVRAAAAAGADVRCNHVLRTAPAAVELQAAGGPFRLALVGGAYGIACNGLHWIDLGLYLDGGGGGRLVHGRLDDESIGSGRGPGFADFGGTALYELAGGSRVYVDCQATSSAPQAATITSPTRQVVFDLSSEGATLFRRDPGSEKPVYLYGADYARSEIEGVAGRLLVQSTARWLAHVADRSSPCALPPVAEAAMAHDLLFDLLETSGAESFRIT